MCFVALEKTFSSVTWVVLWAVLQKYDAHRLFGPSASGAGTWFELPAVGQSHVR